MDKMFSNQDISIRHDIKAGDLGAIVSMHGIWYQQEYDYSLSFELYVAKGLCEFYNGYSHQKDHIWIVEHGDEIRGSMMLMGRGTSAQLRYFFLHPAIRGLGLGTKLMQSFLEILKEKKYASAYLWTTSEQLAAAVLYRRFGFNMTEERMTDRFGKKVTEQRYVL